MLQVAERDIGCSPRTANISLRQASIHDSAYLSIGVARGTGAGRGGAPGVGDCRGIGVGLYTILHLNFREFIFHDVG